MGPCWNPEMELLELLGTADGWAATEARISQMF